MEQKTIAGAIIGVLLLVVLAVSSLFIVDQTETAFVLQFGEFVKVYKEPGLKAKIPFIQEVVFYDKRLLNENLPAIEVTAGDQKRIVVDLFTRYSISDPVLFYKTLGDLDGARLRLATLVPNKMREAIANYPLSALLSKDREVIMDRIHKQVQAAAKGLGIDVRDVRIIRADLPKENSEAIFKRMRSERQREAALLRAQGDKRAQEIQSGADREKAVKIADAKKKSEELRGQGDAVAIARYRQSFSKDPDFTKFWLSMNALKETMNPTNTTYVIGPDNSLFKYIESEK